MITQKEILYIMTMESKVEKFLGYGRRNDKTGNYTLSSRRMGK